MRAVILTSLMLTGTAVLLPHTANAGASDFYNQKLPCAVIVKGKSPISKTCTADGVEFGNTTGGGMEMAFKPVGKYRNITVSVGCTESGEDCISYARLNGKDAATRLRMPNLELLTDAQKQAYDAGTLKQTPYTCLYGKGHAYEFCFAY